jgi:hypothetical protein
MSGASTVDRIRDAANELEGQDVIGWFLLLLLAGTVVLHVLLALAGCSPFFDLGPELVACEPFQQYGSTVMLVVAILGSVLVPLSNRYRGIPA